MKRNILTVLLIAIVLMACGKQPKTLEKTNPQSSLLWEVSGNGLTEPSYLFGTIHIISKNEFFLPENTIESMEKANALVMEISLDIPIKEQIAMAQKMVLPAGTTMADYMEADEYASFKSLCIDSIGISEKKFERYAKMKPFFVIGLLLKEHYGKIESFEQYFDKKAKKMDMEILALETLEYQLSVIDSISIEEQFEDMNAEEFFKEFNKLLTAYKSQDLNKLQAIIEETEMDSETERHLLTTRNENWAKKLEEMMQQQSLFVAVGSAHLPGEIGLINMLEEMGYTVKPL